MGSWNSDQLELLYAVLGWLAFASWSVCFYPQVILNYRRKSVVGLNFDFVVLNLCKHSFYLVYNVSLYFSAIVQKQYREKHGANEMIPVAANDVAFSIHTVSILAFMTFQIAIYERGDQKVSKTASAIMFLTCAAVAVCVIIAAPDRSWFWLMSCLNTIQVILTIFKYIPQIVENHRRKSTVGFSILYVLLDTLGGIANICQMAVHSIDQKSLVNLKGNLGKLLLSLLTLVFCGIFTVQHYALYCNNKGESADPNTRGVHGNRSRDVEE